MTFFTYDDDLDPDERNVLEASAVLQITEFHLFELAYERWFGEEATEQKVEPFYIAYMFRTVIPPWVRHFARDVVTEDRAGHLDPTAFGVFPREESVSRLVLGLRYAAVILTTLVGLHLAAILVTLY